MNKSINIKITLDSGSLYECRSLSDKYVLIHACLKLADLNCIIRRELELAYRGTASHLRIENVKEGELKIRLPAIKPDDKKYTTNISQIVRKRTIMQLNSMGIEILMRSIREGPGYFTNMKNNYNLNYKNKVLYARNVSDALIKVILDKDSVIYVSYE